MELEIIMNQFGPSVYSFALSRLKNESDASDVYQHTFLKLFEKKPTFENKAQLKAWLMKTAYHSILDIIKKRSRECELNDIYAAPDKTDMFCDIIDTLPQKYRDAVYLFYGEQMKISEIAQVLAITESGVKSRLLRAKQMLKEELSDEN